MTQALASWYAKPKQTMSNQINIASTHATVAEAVAAAKLDLSYNEQVAQAKIRDLDKGFRGCKAVEAFVTDKGEVLFVFKCDILILQKFEPFHSTMDDSAFRIAVVSKDKSRIVLAEGKLSRSKEQRAAIGKMGCTVTTLAA